MKDFYIGILSGIATSLLIWIVIRLFDRIIIPYLRQALSNGPIIDGAWQVYYDTSPHSSPIGEARVRQRFDRVSGHVTTNLTREGQYDARTFRFSGKFSSGIATVTYEDIAMPGYIVGVVFLKLNSDGDALTGKTLYYRHDLAETVALDYALRRVVFSNLA